LSSNEIKVADLESKMKIQEDQLRAEKDANSKLQNLLQQQKTSISKVIN